MKPLVSSIDTSEVVTLSARTATLMASPYEMLAAARAAGKVIER